MLAFVFFHGVFHGEDGLEVLEGGGCSLEEIGTGEGRAFYEFGGALRVSGW